MAYYNRLINQPPSMPSQLYGPPNVSSFSNDFFPVEHSLPDAGLPPVHFRHPVDMREAFLREIEKESIREKIIAEEIARTRFLNAEVKMEEDWALRRGQRLPSSGGGMTTRHEFSQFEVVRYMERRVESRVLELPFQQWNAEPRTSAMPFKNHFIESPYMYPYDAEKLSREQRISKEGMISKFGTVTAKLLEKPYPYHHLSGVKRRADMAAEPLKVISNNFSRTEVLKKMKYECSPTGPYPKENPRMLCQYEHR